MELDVIEMESQLNDVIESEKKLKIKHQKILSENSELMEKAKSK